MKGQVLKLKTPLGRSETKPEEKREEKPKEKKPGEMTKIEAQKAGQAENDR
jgi:hypothetical protein